MNTAIIKTFGSGQITIPKKWRDDIKTSAYRARKRGNEIILSPFEEEVVFDATRDNEGKPINAKDFLKALNAVIKNG
jgi:bifunctional DNA-binding transcriptional regulator/antitoxin component of YhaV-PrlF toxin-antitoxin module